MRKKNLKKKKEIDMNKIFLISLFGILFLSFVLAASFGSAERFEFYRVTGDTIDNIANQTDFGQLFTVGNTGINQSFTLKGLVWNISNDGTPVGNGVFKVYAVNSTGVPNTTVLSEATVAMSALGGTVQLYNVTMPDVNLTANQQYFMAFEAEDDWREMEERASPTYGGGTMLCRTRGNAYSGTAPEACNGYDLAGFEVWGLPIFPSIILNAPANAFASLGQAIIFNATAVDETTLQNMSFILNGAYNGTNSSVFNNTLTQFPRTLAVGNYNWTVEACDNLGQCYNATTRTFSISNVVANTFTFNATTLETKSETFYSNITTDGAVPSSAELIYNGTSTTATITSTAGNNYNLSATIDIPSTAESKPHFWNVTVNGVETSTGIQNQTVNLTNFTYCLGEHAYVNITFKNETIAEENVTSVIDSTWYYYLGTGDVVKTLSFTNTSENNHYAFCLNGTNQSLSTNLTMTYNNDISQQRNYLDQDFPLTNQTSNLSLFLLPTVDGQFVTFQVINLAEQPLSGVFSNVTKSGTLISSGTTDDAGAIAYFLDPDTSYFFWFNRSDTGTFTTTLTPSQTSYTITLGGVTGVSNETTSRGINYTISPDQGTSLTNDTNTFFNFSLTSSFWTVSSYGFTLRDQTGAVINASNETANGGTVFVFHNVSNATLINMTAFWIIEGNTTTVTTRWIVFDDSGTGFGINTFFTDVSTYLTSGMFGLTTNSLSILIFFVIFITAGVFSFKFGLTSPASISLVVISLVAFFEIVLELIPTPGNFPLITVLLLIIFGGMMIRDSIL